MIADFLSWLDGYTQAIEDLTGLMIFILIGLTGYLSLRDSKNKPPQDKANDKTV